MNRQLKISVLTGLSFAGISTGLVRLFGFNKTVFIALAYGYIVLSLIIAFKYESEQKFGGFRKLLDRIVIVAEDEEKKFKRLFSGEKYKIKGEVERLG